MYNRSKRFDKQPSITPASVGPGSYNINGGIGTNKHGYAPFLSWKPRDLSLNHQDSLSMPAPNHYRPEMSKRILGGTSIQNKTPRFNYLVNETPGPCDYPTYSAGGAGDTTAISPRSGYSGKLIQAPLRKKTDVAIPFTPSMIFPASNKKAYEETPISHPIRKAAMQTRKCSPCVLHGSMEFGRYKGVHFGKMAPRNASVDLSSEPGPGDYDIFASNLYIPIPYTAKRWWRLLCGRSLHKKTCTPAKSSGHVIPVIIPSPENQIPDGAVFKKIELTDSVRRQPTSQRYLDILVQNSRKENFPAPNAYNVMKEGLTPRKFGNKLGRRWLKAEESEEEKWKKKFAQSVRERLHFKRRNVKHVVVQPFISKTPRFKTVETGPGPGDYDGCVSSFDGDSGGYPIGVAFLRQVARFDNPRVFHTPGPGEYNKMGMVDELLKRLIPRHCLSIRDPPKNLGFGSSGPRAMEMVPKCSRDLPGPSDYDPVVRQCSWKDKKRSSRRATVPVRSAPGRAPPEVVHCGEPKGEGVREGTRAVKQPRSRRHCIKARKPLFNPFETTRGEVTPGPALYYPEKAKDTAVLKRSFCVRMNSRTKRFPDHMDTYPDPGQYQSVTTEMLKRSLNVKIEGGRSTGQVRRRAPQGAAPPRVPSSASVLPARRRPTVRRSTAPWTRAALGKRFSATRVPGETL